ncbi:MAG: dehydrogenase [bacterium]|nr:dehydrogenase [bacterium]
MQVLFHQDALGLLDYAPLIDYLEACHRQPPARVGDSYTGDSSGNGLLARAGFALGAGLGIKLATVFPANIGLPSVHTVYVAFDPSTGEERAVIFGNALTWFKTACDSALAGRYLARPDATHLLMVGAGAMAPHLIRAHRAALPSIELITIWNRTPARAEALALELTDLSADVNTDLRAAVESADLVSCATMTVEPLIKGAWLRPGTHLDLVGSYLPHMREADDDAISRSRVFVDSRNSAFDTGEIAVPITTGAIADQDVLGDLYELGTGAVPGRTRDDDITFFKNAGGGHLDLMAAQYLLTRL